MAHKHSVRDTGAHFTIDQFTRQIKNDSANKTTIVQYDHNSERLTFEIPLYVDGHAMTLCDLIEIHYINISKDGSSQNKGTYEVNDIKAEGENAVFTWLISQECTQLSGSLNFFIVFKCTESGVTVYRWGTEIYKNLAISDGMDNGEAVLTEYPDILAQWKAQLFDASDTAVLNVATAEANALAAIEEAGEAKKQAVLDSIPDEYEALSALADSNYRNKAGAIVLDAEGESIVVNDASEYPLQNLKVFGKSTQDGTPTPDAPVDIVSVENPVVTVAGKNLIAPETNGEVRNGFTKQYNTEDGSITISGSAAAAVDTVLHLKDMSIHPFLNGGRTYSLKVYKDGEPVPFGIKQVFTDGDVTWGWKQVETRDRRVTQIYIQKTPSVGDTSMCGTYRVQLEVGAEVTEYEPYKPIQTIPAAHTLPGIPVSSGGNYTDANGQEWICDEVDLARGVYVQRVNTIILDGSSDEVWGRNDLDSFRRFTLNRNDIKTGSSRTPFVCSHFSSDNITTDRIGLCFVGTTTPGQLYFYPSEEFNDWVDWTGWLSANPITVLYALATPIETALSDAEITAFKALHSNRPNTTIQNDAGAHMAVSYVADTKTYIDNAIAKITNA